MKRLFKRFFFAIIVLAALLGLNKVANLTYYNPAVIISLYGWLDKYGLAKPAEVVLLDMKEEFYPPVSISQIQNNLFALPRAAVIGTVAVVVHVSDGDWHVNVKDLNSDRIMITEIVPEYLLPPPAVGQKIKIWGIVRYDLDHRWWELHPVFGWEKK